MDKNVFLFSIPEGEALAHDLGTSLAKGLSAEEATKRLRTEGVNEVGSEHVYWWQILFRQFVSPFIYLLVAAALLAFFLGESFDALFIFLIVLVNAFLGFYQEFRSEHTLRLLREYTASTARVIRNGKEEHIKASALVVGDVVVLEPGDMVPADLRIVTHGDVTVDETALTGESVPVHKNGKPLQEAPKDMYGAKNLVFAGTNIVSGLAQAMVIATGKQTMFGLVKKLTAETVKESIFAKGIARFSSFILKLVVITLVFVFAANIAIKGDTIHIAELIIFSIALAVSVIPEALPVVITLSLSSGALKLARKKVITKRLSAIEDLGSIEVLCTDKTGTITENKLKVFELWSVRKNPELLHFANLAGAAFKKTIEPFDLAIQEMYARRSTESKKFHLVAEYPFDPARRRNSVVVADAHGKKRMLVCRGAPEELMRLCAPMNASERSGFNEWLAEQGGQGNRTLAVAVRELSSKEAASSDVFALEKNLHFEGCLSFTDPIKKTAFMAVKKAEALGVRIKIVTGDSLEVAFAVAKNIGLAEDKTQAVLASDFVALAVDKQKQLLDRINVFARTNPEQKHHIIRMLQAHYEVGFLGEGINDSPALKAAGVSLVVQGASDIAREAADVILLEKNLTVIIEGIEEGRKIFANTVKYIKATLSSNFGNFYAVAIGSLFIDFLPMLPVQLLLLNILSDFPMIAIATDSVDQSETRMPERYNVKDVILAATILGIVSTVFDFMFFGFFYRISPEVLQTNWFIGSILTELAFLFSIRTRLPFYKAAIPSRSVIALTATAAIATIILPFTAVGSRMFHFLAPSYGHMALIVGLVLAYFVCSEIVKNVYYRYSA